MFLSWVFPTRPRVCRLWAWRTLRWDLISEGILSKVIDLTFQLCLWISYNLMTVPLHCR